MCWLVNWYWFGWWWWLIALLSGVIWFDWFGWLLQDWFPQWILPLHAVVWRLRTGSGWQFRLWMGWSGVRRSHLPDVHSNCKYYENKSPLMLWNPTCNISDVQCRERAQQMGTAPLWIEVSSRNATRRIRADTRTVSTGCSATNSATWIWI